MSSGSLELKKFDMRSIVFDAKDPEGAKGPVIVMIGRRDTGKSVLVRDLLYFPWH
jgi:archaellum biogenesis ATPase FlaH